MSSRNRIWVFFSRPVVGPVSVSPVSVRFLQFSSEAESHWRIHSRVGRSAGSVSISLGKLVEISPSASKVLYSSLGFRKWQEKTFFRCSA